MAHTAAALVGNIVATLRQRGIPTTHRPLLVSFEVGGRTLYLRPWSSIERAQFWQWIRANPTKPRLHARLFCMSVCDERGELLFNLDDADFDQAESIPLETLVAVANRACEINGMP